MATNIEYALMAGAAYFDTRVPNNRFPTPQNWVSFNHKSRASGFEAISFSNGTEIVISYAGTYDKDITGDIAADIGLATGFGSAQLLQAAEYYLQVKAANPFATITLTGHSLGGGLAAQVGVFFGVEAKTFDQAPFANSAELNLLTPDVAANLKSDLAAQRDVNGNRLYSDAALSGLTNFLYLRAANGYIPNSGLVSNIRVNGEFLSSAPLSLYDTIGTPATVLDHGPYADPSLDMHSQALLTAFLQSDQTAATGKALSDVTYGLTDVLGMMFDSKLFAHPTDDPDNKSAAGKK